MKSIIIAFVFCLTFSQVLWAEELPSVEGDQTLLIYDPVNESLSKESLDSNGVLVKPGPGGGSHGGGQSGGGHAGGGHSGGGQSGGGHTGGGGHGGGGHGGGGVVHGGHGTRPPGHWQHYPGWHHGWHHDRGWHPGWWSAGYVFPPWVWGDVPYGYWQCTAFNGSLQAFTRFGPTEDEAAYGALYACGGSNFQQFGCYIPEGYCQPN